MTTPQNQYSDEHPVPAVVSDDDSFSAKKPVISAQQLLDALDTQIKFEADNQRNEGWTRWAIWGAIAALVWIATSIWAQPSLSIPRMVCVSLLFFVLWKFLEDVIWVLLPITRIEVGPARFQPATDTIHPLKPEMVVTIVQYLLIINALVYLKLSSQWFLWIYALLAFGFSAFGLCFGGLVIGVPTKFVNLITKITVGTYIQLICLGSAGFQISMVIYSNFGSYSLPDVRLALLLNAITFLVSRLVIATSSEHLLRKLTQLRQHLAFGRISLSEARENAEELLAGVTMEKLFNPLVQSILDEEAKLQSRLVEANQTLDKVNEEMTASEPRPQEALRLLDLMGSPPAAVFQQLKQNRKAWGRFVVRTVAFNFYSQESRSEIKAITDKVNTRLSDVNAKLKECFGRYYSLKKEALDLAAASQGNSYCATDAAPVK